MVEGLAHASQADPIGIEGRSQSGRIFKTEIETVACGLPAGILAPIERPHVGVVVGLRHRLCSHDALYARKRGDVRGVSAVNHEWLISPAGLQVNGFIASTVFQQLLGPVDVCEALRLQHLRYCGLIQCMPPSLQITLPSRPTAGLLHRPLGGPFPAPGRITPPPPTL